MTFFDKKEEVMKIELTPYGKYLLSIGKLKPHSYKFFDENVVYDSQAAGFSEEQNSTHVRITDETPLLKSNPNITGVETNIDKLYSKSISIKDKREIINEDIVGSTNESIGSCAHDSRYNSAIRMEIFDGNLIENDISTTYTSANIDNAPIPQIPINMYISASSHEDIDGIFDIAMNGITSYPDGTGFALEIIEPILRLREFNGFDEKDNFVITAYKILSSSSGIKYHRLRMRNTEPNIVGGLLLTEDSPNILNLGVTNQQITTDDLSFYINITTDREIPDDEICQKVKDFEIENIFLDDEIICPDTIDDSVYDIYTSLVRPEDLEDCD